MKFVTGHLKRAVLIYFAASLALQLHGQGTVYFSNIVFPAAPVIMGETITFGTNTYLLGTRAPAGTIFTVGLYFAPVDPANPTVRPDGSAFTVQATGQLGPLDGLYRVGTVTIPGISPPGGLAWLEVRAWETACGSTY